MITKADRPDPTCTCTECHKPVSHGDAIHLSDDQAHATHLRCYVLLKFNEMAERAVRIKADISPATVENLADCMAREDDDTFDVFANLVFIAAAMADKGITL